MARRTRKPLLPQLIWGPPARTRRQASTVAVRRVYAQPPESRRLLEDFLVAAVISVGLVAILV